MGDAFSGNARAVDDGTDPVAARVARNEATFREANERIVDVAEGLDRSDERLPILCECADPRCTKVLLVTSAEYADVRRDPTRFLSAPGHVANAEGWGRVVAETDRFTVVEKLDDAARIAAELDARRDEEPV